jgi:hypothetical protein
MSAALDMDDKTLDDKKLLRQVLLSRVLFAIRPFVDLDLKTAQGCPLALQTLLETHKVPRDLRTRLLDLLGNQPLPEFKLVEDFAQLCGTAVSSASVVLSPNVTVEKLVCSNNPDMGEIVYHLQERDLVFKSFDLERDWAGVTDQLLAEKPRSGFSLTDVVRDLLCGRDECPALVECVARQNPVQLAAAAQQELELVKARARPSLELLAGLPAVPPVGLCVLDQVRAVVAGFGVSNTELELIAQDVAELLETAARQPDSPSFPDLLQRVFSSLSELRAKQSKSYLWPQMLSVLRRAGDDVERLTKLSALSSMAVPVPSPSPSPAGPRTVLVPLNTQDFAVVFSECRQVFAMCDSPLGHALLAPGRCLFGSTPECLRVCDCASEAHLRLEPALRDTALLLQGKAHMESFEEMGTGLETLTMSVESRRPLGYFTKYVRTEHALPGEEQLSPPDDRGFVAVKRAVVPPAAVITFTFTLGLPLRFVVQAL